MNRDQDDTRASGPVVETPAAPPRVIWLLLPLGVAAALLVWGTQLQRPERNRMWTAAQDLTGLAASPAPTADPGRTAMPLPQPATSLPAEPRGVLGAARGSADSLAADPAVTPPAREDVLIAEGVLIAIDSASPTPPPVVAAPAVSPARSLPPEVALVAALRAGQLQPAAPGDFERWKLRYAGVNHASIRQSLDDLTAGTNAYVIRRDFEFPPGLHGAHSALFLVEPGVPFPRGDPGHSMILDQSTGTCMGFRCSSLRD